MSEPIHFRGRALRAAKHYFDGTHRTCSPAETHEKLTKPRKIAGITRLAEIGGLDRIGVPVALAIRPNGLTLAQSAGKGFTREAALVSATVEALELFHVEEIELPVEERAYASLSRDTRVPLDRLPLARHSLFDELRPIPLTPAWNLLTQQEVAVPSELVEMGRGARRRGLARFPLFQTSSTGLAGGNDLLEAMLHGLLEVVERDAATLCEHAWFKHGIVPARVRLETIVHARVQALLERLGVAEIDVVLLDHTVDTQVPVYAAYIVDRLAPQLGIYGGYGAHLDPEVAMLRALTEAVQSRAIVIAGSRDDFFRDQFRRHRSAGRLGQQPLLALAPTVDARQRPSRASDSCEGDLHVILSHLCALALEQVLVIDLTREDCQFPMVKVLVPGLEPYVSPSYTPGPRALRWAARGRR